MWKICESFWEYEKESLALTVSSYIPSIYAPAHLILDSHLCGSAWIPVARQQEVDVFHKPFYGTYSYIPSIYAIANLILDSHLCGCAWVPVAREQQVDVLHKPVNGSL